MSDVQPLSDAEDSVLCPKCGAEVSVELVPDQKPDGTILGYARAHCKCGHWLTEDEIYA